MSRVRLAPFLLPSLVVVCLSPAQAAVRPEPAPDLAPATLTGHKGVIECVTFSPDGKLLASASGDGNVRVWDVTTRKELASLTSDGEGRIYSIRFAPDGKTLAFGDTEGRLVLWDVQAKKQRRAWTWQWAVVRSVAFSPDGKTLAAAGWVWDTDPDLDPDSDTDSDDGEGTVRFWSVDTGAKIADLQGQKEIIYSLAYTPDGASLVTGSHDGSVKVWDVATREVRAARRYRRRVDEVRVTRDGKNLVVTAVNKVMFWEMSTLRQRRSFNNPGSHTALSPDEKTLAFAGWYVHLIDVAAPGEVVQVETDGNLAAAFSPDGKLLAVGNRAGRIELNSVAEWRKRGRKVD
jgi:tricorn protease-like protein